jgi:hypothetical protein
VKSTRTQVFILAALVLLVRLPFLNQAVAGDDVYYLASAYHALIDPLHPNHTHYIFQGIDVTFEGYPHPPGNAWFLAGLLAVFGDVREIPFHAAYLLFTLIAVLAMYSLGRRFSCAPFWAAILFLLVPALFVNGNGFESDVPLLAFWMAGAAAFIYSVDSGRLSLLALAAICLAVSGFIAMQSFAFTLILLCYLWTQRKWTVSRVIVASMPVLVLISWQLFERLTAGHFPAQVLSGYLVSYGLERFAMKLRNALALTIHSCFLVFPIVLPFIAREAWKNRRTQDTRFLLLWIFVFLILAWGLFVSGSARYLLPMAAPVVLLASRAPTKWLKITCGVQLVISVSLAVVNYQHWDAYRKFAASLRPETLHKRVWVAGEWGLRHYLEADGALPIHRGQAVRPGDFVVESDLGYPANFSHGGSMLVQIAQVDINPWPPLRIIGIHSKSGFSTASAGLLPYGFNGGLIDRVHAYEVVKKEPKSSVLSLGAADVDSEIVSGVYGPEAGPWRWMSGEATLLLKNPGKPARLEVKVYVSDNAPARQMVFGVEGQQKTESLPGPGTYTFSMPVHLSGSDPVTVLIKVDKTFSVTGDSRVLGVILNEVGLY